MTLPISYVVGTIGITHLILMFVKRRTMDKSGTIGAEGTYDVNFSGGNLNLSLGYKGAHGGASITGTLPVDALIEAIEAKATNGLEKSALELLRTLLKVA